VFAFLHLCHVPFRHEHILDASAAPRGQLPYIIDGGETAGDSDTIIAYLTRNIAAENRRDDPNRCAPRKGVGNNRGFS
jgi:hypothetical protein